MTFTIASYATPLTTRDGRRAPGRRAQVIDADLDRLCASLTRFRSVPVGTDKLDLPAWAPHRLSEPWRKSDNVIDVSCLVYDYDDGTTIEQAHLTWAPWMNILHTSWSHTPEHHKFRVVLPLVCPIPASYFLRAWKWGAQRSGLAVDRSCKDASRLYFLPATDGERATVARVHDGPLADLRPFDGLLPEHDPRPPRNTTPSRHDLGPRTRTKALYDAIRERNGKQRIADAVGAQIIARSRGDIAKGAPCPGCGDRSVWWPMGTRTTRGRCEHLNTCGWSGSLLDVVEYA